MEAVTFPTRSAYSDSSFSALSNSLAVIKAPAIRGTRPKALVNHNGDAEIVISDGIGLLQFLFSTGPPPASGTDCLAIPGCPRKCGGL